MFGGLFQSVDIYFTIIPNGYAFVSQLGVHMGVDCLGGPIMVLFTQRK